MVELTGSEGWHVRCLVLALEVEYLLVMKAVLEEVFPGELYFPRSCFLLAAILSFYSMDCNP